MIGSACKWLNADGSPDRAATFRTTTVRHQKGAPHFRELVAHNVAALRLQLEHVSALVPELRMWRLGSDFLPLYTHEAGQPHYKTFWRDYSSDLQELGDYARRHRIRLSFHPAQFVVLGSQNPGIRQSSLEEMVYHCDVFRALGYSGFHDHGTAVNVHVGVKNADVRAMRRALADPRIKEFVTLENDEFSWGLRETVEEFGDLCPIVMDLHHHWIKEGKRINPDSPLVAQTIETWRGVRPKLHFSISRQELCPDPVLRHRSLVEAHGRAALRAHSDSPWHLPSVDWALKFLPAFDLMWEGKDKNLGAQLIYARRHKVRNPG